MTASVLAVHLSPTHSFSKARRDQITLVAGRGVEGDAHCGETVRHRSRVAADPTQPNLRQVHLIHRELFDVLAHAGYRVLPGELGENITTDGLAVLELPERTRLHIGPALITVTGLRNPCQQINSFAPGLLKQVLRRRENGRIERLTGIMGVIDRGGTVRPGDEVRVELPARPHRPLERV